MQTRHLVIHGRVQGVWFRESMRQKAEQLGITGWVRNRADGTVEAIIQGSDSQMTAMLDWTRAGPPLASVTRLDQASAEGEFRVFEVRTTVTQDRLG